MKTEDHKKFLILLSKYNQNRDKVDFKIGDDVILTDYAKYLLEHMARFLGIKLQADKTGYLIIK